jgi:hypothetical protein
LSDLSKVSAGVFELLLSGSGAGTGAGTGPGTGAGTGAVTGNGFGTGCGGGALRQHMSFTCLSSVGHENWLQGIGHKYLGQHLFPLFL